MGIISNNRVRAVATIAYCATDMLAKVYIDKCLGHQHNLKMTPNRLSFEQRIFIATNQYLLVKAIGVRWYRYSSLNAIGLQGYRSMPIAQFNRIARVSIDIYWLNSMDLQGFRSIPTACKFIPYGLEQHTYTVQHTLGYCLNEYLGVIAICTLTYFLSFDSKQQIYDNTCWY